jgi:Transcription factor WhiB
VWRHECSLLAGPGRLPRRRLGGYDPFFADSAELQADAIAICATCLVRDDCLTFAVRTGQQYGIWGGQPERIVRRLIAADRAGRPHHGQAPANHPQASKTHCCCAPPSLVMGAAVPLVMRAGRPGGMAVGMVVIGSGCGGATAWMVAVGTGFGSLGVVSRR